MRVSTIVFLCIFACLFGNVRREIARHTRASASDTSCREHRSEPASDNRARRDIEKELREVDQKLRGTENAIRTLEGTARNLQDIIQRTERDSSRSSSVYSAAARKARSESLAEMRKELSEVLDGHQMLLAQRETLNGRHAVLKAKLELARAGLLTTVDSAKKDKEPVVIERPSPVDALSNASKMIVVR